MKLQFALVLSFPILIGLVGCDKGISTISGNAVKCGDENSLQLIKTLLKDNTQSYIKNIASNEGVTTDSAALRASASQIDFTLADVRTSKTDPNSTKVFCVAALSTTLNSELVNRANFVTDYYEQVNLSELAFEQDIEMDNNTISYSLEYAIQPTDDGTNIYGQLQNGTELFDFIGTAIVNSMQKNSVQSLKSQQQKAKVATKLAQSKAQEDERALVAEATVLARREAAGELAEVSAEQAKSKATMDYKRSELNKLWNSASDEVKESLAEGQREWVAERDEICVNRAREADPAWQEYVRTECITELIGERYYEVKEYIDNYE